MGKRPTQRQLTDAEEQFVTAIASGVSISEICRVINITRQTGHNWLKRPEIKDAVDRATRAREEERVQVVREYQSTRTQVMLTEIDAKVKGAVPDAIDTYIKIMREGRSDKDKIAAADRIIKLAGITEEQVSRVSHGTERSVSKQGLSEDVADQIRRNILGVGAGSTVNLTTGNVDAPVVQEAIEVDAAPLEEERDRDLEVQQQINN
ncbi:MAG TPA: hypothetical protein V6D33_12440 [Cyanophyceae cyanobacterium]